MNHNTTMALVWCILCLTFLGINEVNSQNCALDWLEYADMTIPGGTLQPAITNSVACRTACESDPNCVAYEFVTGSTLPCYFIAHITMENRAPQSGTNHYQYEGTCKDTLGSSCRFRFVGEYTYTSDLAASAGITTEDGCLLDCMRKTTCISAAFKASDSTCLMATTTTLAVDGHTRQDGRRQYLKDETMCDIGTTCALDWLEYAEMTTTGGTLQPAMTTLAACRTGCESDTDCAAYDFVPASILPCFFISDVAMENRSPQSGTNHYQYEGTCTDTLGSSCRFRFVGEYTYNSDLAASAGITTEGGCLVDCMRKTTCISAAFQASDSTCLLATSMTLAVDSRIRQDGRRQYLKDERMCDIVTTCTLDWLEYADMTIPGGTLQPAATTSAACRTGCESNTNCAAYDFITGSNLPCFFISGVAMENRSPQSGTNHYQYEGTCTDTLGSSCRFRFVGEYTYTSDLAASAGIITEDGCLLDCMRKSACISAAFQASDMTCLMATTTTLAVDGRTRQDGRRQYLKDETMCAIVTTTESITMTATTTAGTEEATATMSTGSSRAAIHTVPTAVLLGVMSLMIVQVV